MFLFASERDDFGGKTIYPRVPETSLGVDPDTTDLEEDITTKRICISNSIVNCLNGCGRFNTDDIVYIYECEISDHNLHFPTEKEVPDVNFTGEIWALSSVKLKKFAAVIVDSCIIEAIDGVPVCQCTYSILNYNIGDKYDDSVVEDIQNTDYGINLILKSGDIIELGEEDSFKGW